MRLSTKYLICEALATLLCLYQATIATATEKVTNWYGLGDSECYGQTCTFGQFCSKSFLFRSCRSCDDVVIWCDTNLTHMAYQFPTCFYLCERKEKERLQAEVEGRPILDNLHISLIVMLVALAASHVVVPLRRFRRKRQQSNLQTGFSQNNGSDDDNNAAPDTATDAKCPFLTHVVDMDASGPLESAPLSDDDTATDPKTPSLPTAPPPEEEPQDHHPPQSTPVHSDSSTSDLDTSADDDTADADDDGNNDNDSGVLVSAQEQGQVVRGSRSVEPELQPPVQIQDGINNFSIKTTDESEKGPLLATGVDNVDAIEHLI